MTPARRRAVITRLAYRVMNEINAVTAVTPGSLVATALLAHDRRGLPHADLVAYHGAVNNCLHKGLHRSARCGFGQSSGLGDLFD